MRKIFCAEIDEVCVSNKTMSYEDYCSQFFDLTVNIYNSEFLMNI